MDICSLLVEDVGGGVVPSSSSASVAVGGGLPQNAEIPNQWVHPELKRLRVDQRQRAQEKGRRLEFVESNHKVVEQRVERLVAVVHHKQQQLDALTRRRDQLAQEVQESELNLEQLRAVQEACGDQLIFHRTNEHARMQSNGNGGSENGGQLLRNHCAWFDPPPSAVVQREAADDDNVEASSFMSVPLAHPGALSPPCCLQTLGLQWSPLGRRGVAPLSQRHLVALRAWMHEYLPIVDLDDDGLVAGLGRIPAPCLMETSLAPCASTACRYVHVAHNAAHLHVVLRHVCNGIASLCDEQAKNICCVADFLHRTRQAMAVHVAAQDEVALDRTIVEVAHHVVNQYWWAAHQPLRSVDGDKPRSVQEGRQHQEPKSTENADGGGGGHRGGGKHLYRPPSTTAHQHVNHEPCFAAPIKTSWRMPNIIDRVFDKSLQYFPTPDDRTAVEHVALQCSTAITSSPVELSPLRQAETIVQHCMATFEVVQLSVLWRLAARAFREVAEHVKARWLLETAILMFPTDPALRVELMHCSIALREDPISIVKFVSTSLDILTNQANALTMSKQKPVFVTVLSKNIAYMLAYTAVHISDACCEAAGALLTCAVDAPGRYAIGPYALHNLALMLAVLRGTGRLDSVGAMLPLAAVSDVCFALSQDVVPAQLKEPGSQVLKKQLDLMGHVAQSGVSARVVENTRTALYSSIFQVFADDAQVLSDTIGHLDVEPRTFNSEVWAQYFNVMQRQEGHEAVCNAVKDITVSPVSPMWLHLRIAAVLGQYHCPNAFDERLRGIVKMFGKAIKCEPHQLTPALVSDSQVHTRYKTNGFSWIAFVICAAATFSNAHQSLLLLRAIPKSLLAIQLDASIVLCFEKLAYCLRDTVNPDQHPLAHIPTPGEPHQPRDGATMTTNARHNSASRKQQCIREEVFADIVRDELVLLQESATQWLCMVDWYAEDAITAAHHLVLSLYRDLPSLCPPEAMVQQLVPQLRRVLIEVASERGALHPLLRTVASSSSSSSSS